MTRYIGPTDHRRVPKIPTPIAQKSRGLDVKLGLVAQLKAQHGIKVVVISNESREVNARRIATFRLDRVVDAFISSCFVGMRKPDLQIFRIALDVAQTEPANAIFIDNTPMFVQIASVWGCEASFTSIMNRLGRS